MNFEYYIEEFYKSGIIFDVVDMNYERILNLLMIIGYLEVKY